jgi:anti-sigma-K factor RskA
MGTDTATLEIPGLVDLVEIGSSHTLYRACDEIGNRTVAVRLLDCDADDRFECAMMALSALACHPYAVDLHGSGATADGRGYALLELLEEGSLSEWVASDGRLSCAEVLDVTLKIAGVLMTAHRAGLVHGALSPEHILVSQSGEPQLAGLELAVVRHLRAMIEGSEQPSVGDDVQALGATMFALLTAASLTDGTPEVKLERCAVPSALQALIHRCLSGNLAARPPSIEALAIALQQIQIDLGSTLTEPIIDETAADEALEILHEATAPLPPEFGLVKMLDESRSAVEWEPAVAIEPELEPEPVVHEVPVPEPASEPEPQPEAEIVAVPFVKHVEAGELDEADEAGDRCGDRPPSFLHRRSVWRVLAAGVAALTAAAVMLTLRLHDTRPAAPPAPSAAPVASAAPALPLREQQAKSTFAVYTGFRTVTDETKQLSMVVPEQWSVLKSSVWTLDGEKVGRQLEATLPADDGQPASPSTARRDAAHAGVVLAMSETLGRSRTVEQVLDKLRADHRACTYVGRKPFDDNIYAGAIDSYTGCGAARTDIDLLVASPADRSRMVMVQITRQAPRDVTAGTRVLETFDVRPA